MTKANSKTVIKLIKERCISSLGRPKCIISDHGTEFKGGEWRRAMNNLQIKTYKVCVYHPSSSPAERMLKEAGRILRTYCHNQHHKWCEYVERKEEFINLPSHDSTCLLYTSRCV